MNCSELIRQLQLMEPCKNQSSECSFQEFLSYFGYPCNSSVSNSELSQNLDSFISYRIGKDLLLYIPPFMIVTGIIGNILSFIVLQEEVRKVSTYSYLSLLAVMDIFVLVVGLLRLWIAQIIDIDVINISNFSCKVVVFLGYVCSDASVWLIISVTMERFIAVCYPLKTSIVCSVTRARKFCFLPLIGICVINAHFFITVEIRQEKDKNICKAGKHFENLVEDIWPWVDAAIYSFCPVVIICILNGFIMRKISQSEKERQCFLQVSNKSSHTIQRLKSMEKNRKLTVMLLLVSFTFLLTTLPMNLILISTVFWNKNPDRSLHQFSIFYLIKTITELLMYVNHSINFFLYCAMGQKFRKALLNMFCCYKRCVTVKKDTFLLLTERSTIHDRDIISYKGI